MITELDKTKKLDGGKAKAKSRIKKISAIFKNLPGTERQDGAASKSKEPYVVIDHPAQGEKLHPGHYAVRIGASEGPVHISVDGGDWQQCRQNSGYYWWDWFAISPGKHKLAARVALPNGKFKKSKVIQCRAE